ncbi:hypothetical protein Tco_1440639 [Tanacetum coccineum]
MSVPITFPPIWSKDISDEPIIIEADVEGYLVHRVYADQGASLEVMFEHCFENLSPAIKSRLKSTQTDLVGFVEEEAGEETNFRQGRRPESYSRQGEGAKVLAPDRSLAVIKEVEEFLKAGNGTELRAYRIIRSDREKEPAAVESVLNACVNYLVDLIEASWAFFMGIGLTSLARILKISLTGFHAATSRSHVPEHLKSDNTY